MSLLRELKGNSFKLLRESVDYLHRYLYNIDIKWQDARFDQRITLFLGPLKEVGIDLLIAVPPFFAFGTLKPQVNYESRKPL
jgi:hypothetical protein